MKMKLAGTLLTAILATAAALAAAPLVDNGRSDYRIVVPADAIPAERTAAEELQTFLAEIGGVELPIVAETDGPAIHVGQSPDAARALGIADWQELKPDEICLKTVGLDLYLAGDRPRGSLYAVYEFLEQNLGVRFWTAEVTEVPKQSTIELPLLDYRYAPPFEVRAAGYDLARSDPKFAARLRNNGHGVANPPEWGGDVQLLGGVHTFSDNSPLISVQEYYDAHPEWFSERNGKRLNRHVQLCLSNPELRRELTRKVLAWIRSNPNCQYVSVSQNDNQNYCQCATCTAFVEEHGNQADLLIDAVNEVAAEVAPEFPHVLIETLGYNYTRTPPVTVRPLDNVIVRYCTIEAQSFHCLTDPANRQLEEDLTGWRQVARQLMIWNYVTDFHKYYQPHPNWLTVAPDLQLFRDCGAINVYEQGSWNGGGAAADLGDLRAWQISKLLWNPDLDPEALVEEFVAGYYGPAAGYVHVYLDSMIESVNRHPENIEGCYARSTSSWLDADLLLQAYFAMDEAQRKFRDDPVYGPRVATAAIPVNCTLLERPELFDNAALRGVDYQQLLQTTVAAVKAAGVDRLTEGGLSPEEWQKKLEWQHKLRTGNLENDGSAPAVAAGKACHAWSVERVAELHSLGNELFWETDPAASVGRAVRMPNTHNEWHLQSFDFPHGTFDLYMEVRCDSAKPSGNAIRIGTYDWNSRIEVPKDFPAGDIAGKEYRTVKVGRVDLKDNMCIFIAPIINPAVENIWIDRLILVPVQP